MLIEISGMQKAGKSTLIEGLTLSHNLYKFPMGKVCKFFDIKPTWELQVAKDISTLEFYNQVVELSTPLISDRGPLSTIFYSLLFHRAEDGQIAKFVEYCSHFDEWHPVWVKAINQPTLTRVKNDNFDKLQDNLDENSIKLAEQKMFGLLDNYNKSYTIIINDFGMPIEKNVELFQKHIEDIIGD